LPSAGFPAHTAVEHGQQRVVPVPDPDIRNAAIGQPAQTQAPDDLGQTWGGVEKRLRSLDIEPVFDPIHGVLGIDRVKGDRDGQHELRDDDSASTKLFDVLVVGENVAQRYGRFRKCKLDNVPTAERTAECAELGRRIAPGFLAGTRGGREKIASKSGSFIFIQSIRSTMSFAEEVASVPWRAKAPSLGPGAGVV
jgi:hypothetical protein